MCLHLGRYWSGYAKQDQWMVLWFWFWSDELYSRSETIGYFGTDSLELLTDLACLTSSLRDLGNKYPIFR